MAILLPPKLKFASPHKAAVGWGFWGFFSFLSFFNFFLVIVLFFHLKRIFGTPWSFNGVLMLSDTTALHTLTVLCYLDFFSNHSHSRILSPAVLFL